MGSDYQRYLAQAATVADCQQIYEQYFGRLSAAVMSRLVHWQLSSPDRYALLAVMVGLDADTLFGPALGVIDPLLERLLSYKETGIVYGKNDLAAKYHIEPFWRQIRQDRCKCIRLLLTEAEYESISEAAKKNSSGQLSVFARSVVLDFCRKKEETWTNIEKSLSRSGKR